MDRFMAWSEELSVGIEEIDAQHTVLVELINEMHDAIKDNRDNDLASSVLDKLSEYTSIHFAREERLMRSLHYPGYQEHQEQHQQLVRHIAEMKQAVTSGKTAAGVVPADVLKTWLSTHIVEQDTRYSSFFLTAGPKPKLEKNGWVSRIWANLHH